MKKKVDKLPPELEEQAYKEEGASLEEVNDLMKKIQELEKESAEWKDKYLRSMAEFENFRRRSNQEKSDWIKLATQKMALDVCDVADNFERALLQVKEEHKDDSFVKGMLMIQQQLRGILEREGVCKIEALGEEFDPSQHEALAHIPSEVEENLVAAVIQNGYTMHGKVLRPARVAVSSGKHQDNNGPKAGTRNENVGGNGPEEIEIEIQ